VTLSIATNTAASFATNALRSTEGGLATSVERLSTGKRINSAKDDAAALALSDRLLSRLNAGDVAVRNINDALSFLQTADSAADIVVSQLQRIRELGIQALNTALNANDRQALQEEVSQIFSQALAAQNQAQFNNQLLLDGSFSQKTIQVGSEINQSISLSLPVLIATTTQSPRSHAEVLSILVGPSTLDNDLVINGTPIPNSTVTAGANPSIAKNANSAYVKAQAINSVSNITGVTATAYTKAEIGITGGYGATIASGAITINGVGIPSSTGSNQQNLLDDFISKVNSVFSSTGVTAYKETVSGQNYLNLYSADGSNVYYSGNNSWVPLLGFSMGNVVWPGNIKIQNAPSVSPAPSIVIGGNNPSRAGFTAGTYSATVSDTPLEGLTGYTSPDITSTASANQTIGTVDSIINRVTGIRGQIGANLSRLDYAASHIKDSVGNMSVARSKITDADFAEETSKLARSQIIQQAATAIITQANMSEGTVIALLLNR
jgi:flagellin